MSCITTELRQLRLTTAIVFDQGHLGHNLGTLGGGVSGLGLRSERYPFDLDLSVCNFSLQRSLCSIFVLGSIFLLQLCDFRPLNESAGWLTFNVDCYRGVFMQDDFSIRL